MAITFAVDDNNDLYIGDDGRLVLVRGLQAVLQACAQAAKTLLGEMILQTNKGLPNFETIWNGTPNIPQWEAALRKTILAVVDVTGISRLTTSVTNNTLSYAIEIQTVYGIGEING